MQKLLDWGERLVFHSPYWKLLGVLALITLLKTGVWYVPSFSTYHPLALDPFTNPIPDPSGQFMLWSWFGPFLAWLLGLKSIAMFLLLHMAFALAFTALFFYLAVTRLPAREARVALVFFALLPVSATAYFWVGLDAITLFLLLLLVGVAGLPWWLMLPLGVMLGMQHFEQGVVAISALLFAQLLQRRFATKLWAAWFGVILGKGILTMLFVQWGMPMATDRVAWMQAKLPSLLEQFFFNYHFVLWSIFGLGWVLAFKYLERGRQAYPFFVALLGLLPLVLLVEDQTRVLAIVTFPLVLSYWLLDEDFLRDWSNREVTVLLLLWVIVPWLWVWTGQPQGSVFPNDVALMLHGLFGWFEIPENLGLWPFDSLIYDKN